MMCRIVVVAATLIFSTIAAPVSQRFPHGLNSIDGFSMLKRDSASNKALPAKMSDADTLNYALTLEHIQDALYRQGLQNYSNFDFVNAGFPDPFYANLKKTAAQNAAHVTKLTAALEKLGAPAAAECTYDWSSIEGATAWTLLAKRLSGLVTSAWISLRPSITTPSTLLPTVASIVTSDISQAASLRQALKLPAIKTTALNPLPPFLAWTLAQEYISSCPDSNPTLAVAEQNPALTLAFDKQGPVKEGSGITLSPEQSGLVDTAEKDVTGAFVTKDGPVWFDVVSDGEEGWKGTVPDGVVGQSYVVLNKGRTGLTEESVLAGPVVSEVQE